jgi:two-component system chemotaxis response regulator CheY
MHRTDAKVLVVAAHDLTRTGYRAALGAVGVGHVQAPDGLAAMELLERWPYDVVLAEWATPRLTGVELVRWARSVPTLRAVPIIIVACVFTRARILAAADAGVSGFLGKPFALSALEEKLRIYLGPRQEFAHAP